MVGGKLVVASGDATTLFNAVKGSLDQIARSVEIKVEADWPCWSDNLR